MPEENSDWVKHVIQKFCAITLITCPRLRLAEQAFDCQFSQEIYDWNICKHLQVHKPLLRSRCSQGCRTICQVYTWFTFPKYTEYLL